MTDPRLIDAAEWSERLRADESLQSRFEQWRSDPENAEAWASITRARNTVQHLAETGALSDRRAKARERLAQAREARRFSPWQFAAAACLAMIAPLTMWRVIQGLTIEQAASNRVYRTAYNQRLQTTLADGTRLTLNARTAVRVAYTEAERRLTVEHGQALFEVAKDTRRPFDVVAGAQTVTAHGTIFDVRREGDSVQVALIEGQVGVKTGSRERSSVNLRPDDVLTASSTGVAIRHVPGGAQALASWHVGRVVFVDQTLADAIAEMNRYGPTRIRVAGGAAGRLRVSGSFRIGDQEQFLEALELGFPVVVERRRDGGVYITSRS